MATLADLEDAARSTGPWGILTGNLSDGYQLIGPCTREEASRLIGELDDAHVFPMIQPKDL